MDYLFTYKKSFPSARILATKLGLKVTSNENKIVKPPIIRYGNSLKDFGEDDTNINSIETIHLCSNSILFSDWCRDNNFFTPIFEKFRNENLVYPFLLRKKYHRAGLDIIYIEREEQLNDVESLPSYYKVPFFETEYELGVHVVFGNVVKIFKKIKINDDSHPFIRSMAKGYRYSIVSNIDDNYKKAQSIATNIANCIGLKFGRIDMAFLSKEREYIIWEVNTAPGLNNNTAELYSKILREHLEVKDV